MSAAHPPASGSRLFTAEEIKLMCTAIATGDPEVLTAHCYKFNRGPSACERKFLEFHYHYGDEQLAKKYPLVKVDEMRARVKGLSAK